MQHKNSLKPKKISIQEATYKL